MADDKMNNTTSDEKMNNIGLGAGFMADMLRDLQKQYEIDRKPEGKRKRSKASGKKQGKSGRLTAMPAGQNAQGAAAQGAAEQGATKPDLNMRHVTDPADLHPSDMLLNTYRVESEAFRGGMGAVWRVRHTGWNVDLAMKRPHPEAFRTDEQKKAFTAECKCWMDLGLHPNIVSCYYVREIEGVPSIFSEWMENGSLESHIKDGTLYSGSKEEVQERLLDIAIQFACGLHYAHENNLIHQDVKPDNLLLAGDWTAKVSDFGLAKARSMLTFLDGMATKPEMDENATMVSPGGGRTPAYCSPEQAAAQLLTKRTDIYSWAVSVLEMYLGDKPWAHGRELTGPFVGSVCQDYFDMCVERPIPRVLQDLLAYCLEQDPDNRPHDFGVVEEKLRLIYKNETSVDYPRPEPKAAADTVDSLNNRALSYLDLGKPEEAEALWETAIKADTHNLHSIYNQGLWQWRKGKITDEELLRRVLHANKDQKEKSFRSMMANIHLERGDGAEAMSFLSEESDETLWETARFLRDSKAQYESRFRPCPLSGCETIDAALIPQRGKIIQQVLTADNMTRIVMWDLEGEAEPCILDEWRAEEKKKQREANFVVDDSGNMAAGAGSRIAEKQKITVWDLRENRVFNSYTVRAMGNLSERHRISSDGRWLSVTWRLVRANFTGRNDNFYCIHENGIVSQAKTGGISIKEGSVTFLFELRRYSISRIFYTPWDPEWPMFSRDNKLQFILNGKNERAVISIDPALLQSEKRSLADGEPVNDRDVSQIPMQTPRNCYQESSCLSQDGDILVRLYKSYESNQTGVWNAKLQFVHVPAERCMSTFDAGSCANHRGAPVFTVDGKGVFSPGEKPVIRAVPQWIHQAPMMPAFAASIRNNSLTFEKEREYEGLIQESRRYLAESRLTEALACVDRAWSLREPDDRLIALNRDLGKICIAVGIRSLRRVGSFPNLCQLLNDMKETPVFSRDGAYFVTQTGDRKWQKYDARTLLPLSSEVGFKEYTTYAPYTRCPSAALSPDGRYLYVDYVAGVSSEFVLGKFGISKIDLVTGQTVGGVRKLSPITAPLLSPDGKILYCGGSSECYALSTENPELYRLHYMDFPPSGDDRNSYRKEDRPSCTQKLLSADGRRVYFATYQGPVWAYDLKGWPEKIFEAGHSEAPMRTVTCALSPDDKWLCILREDGQIELLDARNGNLLHIFPAWEQAPEEKLKDVTLTFSPDGNLLLYFLEESIVIYDMRDRIMRGTYSLDDKVGRAVFSPDGRLFTISPVRDGSVYEVDFIYRAPDEGRRRTSQE